MLNPTLSPGSAFCSCWWCISMLFTSDFVPLGIIMIGSPTLRIPVSTLPTGTVPNPGMLNTSCIGSLSGFCVGFSGTVRVSSASRSVGPVYHGILSDFVLPVLDPSSAEYGTKSTLSVLKPSCFSSVVASAFIASYFCWLKLLTSILLTPTISCGTPSTFISIACSLVCGLMPSSALITSTAASAWLAPVIMFFTKSLWPGASIIVKKYLAVWKSLCAMSIVMPRSLSSLRCVHYERKLEGGPVELLGKLLVSGYVPVSYRAGLVEKTPYCC